MESFGCSGTGMSLLFTWRSSILSWIHFISINNKWALTLQVLKYMSTPAEVHRGVEFYSECQYCNSQVRGPSCLVCKKLVFQCCICNLSVRGETMCSYSGNTRFSLQPGSGCLSSFLWFFSVIPWWSSCSRPRLPIRKVLLCTDGVQMM